MSLPSAPQTKAVRAEREFGLIVGGVLVLLAGWWLHRGKFGSAPDAVLALGLALFLLGALFPKALVVPNRLWMALSEALSFVATRFLLAVIFFLVITPIGLIKRLTGWDPLRRRTPPASSYWRPYSARQRDPRHYEKMF